MAAAHPEEHRAGFVSRASADLLDGLLVCVGTVLVLVAATTLRALFAGGEFALPRPGRLGTAGALSLAYVLYLAFFWTATGRTPGKQVAGLRVVTARGRPLSGVRALVRAVVCVAFPVGLLWVLFSRRNLAVHDAVLGTAVVYDWNGSRRAGTLVRSST